MTSSANQSVRHIVVVQFKTDAEDEKINRFTQEFRALQERIPGITDFEYGINNSPEDLNRGFTHIYLLTLESAAARDAYLPHPEHKKFGELVRRLDIIEEIFVVDFAPEA